MLSLRDRRRYWAHHPKKRLVLIVNGLLSLVVIALAIFGWRRFTPSNRYYAVASVVVAAVVWLRYLYDKSTS